MDEPCVPLPDPLWPAEIDLGVFANVEIPVRLFASPAFVTLEPDLRWYQVRLIVAAWHERPAGSLHASPHALAQAAGLGEDVTTWCRVSDRVLEAWTLCSDDRVYFAPMAEVVEEAFKRRRRKVSGQSDAKARRRLRDELLAAGVPDQVCPPPGALGALLEEFRSRGAHEMRGEERRYQIIRVASDAGLLPQDEYGGGGVVDARLAAKFRPNHQIGGSG